MNWRERIATTPDICHGKPCIKGTRIMVTVILDNLADGVVPGAILADYPTLDERDIAAALHYAADLAHAAELPGERVTIFADAAE